MLVRGEEKSVDSGANPEGGLDGPCSGYSIRPLDLLLEDQVDGLLDIAAERAKPEDVLDRLNPTWRDTRRSDFEVFEASDGERAIRARKG